MAALVSSSPLIECNGHLWYHHSPVNISSQELEALRNRESSDSPPYSDGCIGVDRGPRVTVNDEESDN